MLLEHFDPKLGCLGWRALTKRRLILYNTTNCQKGNCTFKTERKDLAMNPNECLTKNDVKELVFRNSQKLYRAGLTAQLIELAHKSAGSLPQDTGDDAYTTMLNKPLVVMRRFFSDYNGWRGGVVVSDAGDFYRELHQNDSGGNDTVNYFLEAASECMVLRLENTLFRKSPYLSGCKAVLVVFDEFRQVEEIGLIGRRPDCDKDEILDWIFRSQ
jgi:hypothetical protein